MKTSLKTAFAVLALSIAPLIGHAQPAPKILVVDLAKLYEGHYKTEEQRNKLKNDEQKANEELERLNKEGQGLVEEYKQMAEQAKNPALTADARSRAEADGQKKMEDIQKKQAEIQNFRANTQRSLQQRAKNFADVILEEITKASTDVAKRHGGTFVVDKSGLAFNGLPNLIYADPGYDITDEVSAEINKGRPAGTPAASSSATPAGKAEGETPTVTFPGSKK